MSAKNGQYKICTICAAEYYVRRNRVDSSKYCSQECWSKRRVLRICEYCSQEIKSYGKKYCSRSCSHKAMVGSNASRWKDGKSLERDRARDGTQLKQWRKDVFCRDNFRCCKCGANKDIQAHHIIEWATDESKRFDIDNGMTLCIHCHGKEHNRDFTKRNNKYCIDCSKKVKYAGTRCHSCATKYQWRMKKLDPTLLIKRNGEPWVT